MSQLGFVKTFEAARRACAVFDLDPREGVAWPSNASAQGIAAAVEGWPGSRENPDVALGRGALVPGHSAGNLVIQQGFR